MQIHVCTSGLQRHDLGLIWLQLHLYWVWLWFNVGSLCNFALSGINNVFAFC